MRRIIGVVLALLIGAVVAAPSVGAVIEMPIAPTTSTSTTITPTTIASIPTTSTTSTSSTSTPTTTPAHVSRAAHVAAKKFPLLKGVAARAGVSVAQLRSEWQHVAICEVNGNWRMTGPVYSGIGFANSTWLEYGGSRFARYAGEAPRDAQILIGMRVTGGWVPDQFGCSPSGW